MRTPGVASTSPKMPIGERAVASRPFALSNPSSHAEIGDTRTFRSAVKDLFIAVTASGLIG